MLLFQDMHAFKSAIRYDHDDTTQAKGELCAKFAHKLKPDYFKAMVGSLFKASVSNKAP